MKETRTRYAPPTKHESDKSNKFSGDQLAEHLLRHLLPSVETEVPKEKSRSKTTNNVGVDNDNDSTGRSGRESSATCSSPCPGKTAGIKGYFRLPSPYEDDSNHSTLSTTGSTGHSEDTSSNGGNILTNTSSHAGTSHDSTAGTRCPFLHMEQLETGEKTAVQRSEDMDARKPRHSVGCTPHECHGAMMNKTGLEVVSNSYSPSADTQVHEAVEFIEQFASETGHFDTDEALRDRIEEIVHTIYENGRYHHTTEELEFGCRLAWRNSGRCIMRKVSFSLELRDCRSITTSRECFEQIVDHLKYAANAGTIKPVISVFPPKMCGESAPVRVWNRQLVGYAAYQREDGNIMGDPVNLAFTAQCAKLGWIPPKIKSDFDVLPIMISDSIRGHDRPQVFELPSDAILEVEIHHPEHDLFSALNLRWYALPAISNMGVDIGGVYYQTAPFNGWYSVTEIGRDILDKQRYDLAEAVAVACGIPRTKLGVWRDDVQLQVHKAILHSFANNSVSLVDHHTASEAFLDFYQSEIKARRKCPGDWIWLTPPAGGSMTGVFHQEMTNFILKPQYRPNSDFFFENGIPRPAFLALGEASTSKEAIEINTEAIVYDRIIICFGSETGTSQRMAARLVADVEKAIAFVEGPLPLDNLPECLKGAGVKQKILVLVITSTFGKGGPPSSARSFLHKMQRVVAGPIAQVSYAVFALGNSAYNQSFAKFGYAVHGSLQQAGFCPVLDVQVGDELMDQAGAFESWTRHVVKDETATIIYSMKPGVGISSDAQDHRSRGEQRVKLSYQGFAQVISAQTSNELDQVLQENLNTSWTSYEATLGRSVDLFSFEVCKDHRNQLEEMRPGDHIVLYPKNLLGSVELILRMMSLHDLHGHHKDLRNHLENDIDLAKPVSPDALVDLWEETPVDEARYVIGVLLKKSSKLETDTSLLDLVNRLPPGSLPVNWLVNSAPKMDPRFYSIASISLEENTISICQGVYSYSNGTSGTTSRWLRSLQMNDVAFGLLSKSNLHLPEDEDAPILMIATGTGIAPYRSFWVSRARNPMYLFFGCRNRQELPFAQEIRDLKRAGRITPYIAYSQEMSDKMYVQDLLVKEASAVLSLLHNPKTHIFICGSPDMANAVQDKLVMVLCQGDETYPAVGIKRAMEKLIIMKQQKRFIAEVYGPLSQAESAMSFVWKEVTAKVVETMTGLEKFTLPRSPVKVELNPILPQKGSWNEQFRPESNQQLKRCSLDSRLPFDIPESSVSLDDSIASLPSFRGGSPQDVNAYIHRSKVRLRQQKSWRTEFGPEHGPKSKNYEGKRHSTVCSADC